MIDDIIRVIFDVFWGSFLRFLERRRHRKAAVVFQAFAQQHGWHYVEYDRDDLPKRFRGEPFRRLGGPYAHHVMVGQYRGHQMAAFQYSYSESSGSGASRRETTTTYSVVALSTSRQRPTLQVELENPKRGLRQLFGRQDLQLESVEFNKTFLIQSENDRFAYDVLHPRMMEWMLADQRTRSLPFRFESTNLLVWHGPISQPPEIMPALDYACDILDRVPAFVWKD